MVVKERGWNYVFISTVAAKSKQEGLRGQGPPPRRAIMS
jgi:hypothetical protein